MGELEANRAKVAEHLGDVRGVLKVIDGRELNTSIHVPMLWEMIAHLAIVCQRQEERITALEGAR